MQNEFNCAIYPGSFDPITNGHLDIIERATKVFDLVDVVVSYNPNKVGLFTVDERVEMIKEATAYLGDKVKVSAYHGLVVDYCQMNNIFTVIRGLRAMSDFDYEFQMALTNRKLNEKVDMVLFVANEKYSYLSSSLTKELATFGADITPMVPACVKDKLLAKYEK